MDLAEIEGLKRRVETLQAERDEAFDHHNTLRAKIASLQIELNQIKAEREELMAAVKRLLDNCDRLKTTVFNTH